MPWFALDTHYLEDPKVQDAGELTPFALSVFPALLADAKQRAEGGKVEVVYRSLAFRLFISEEEAKKAVMALLSAGVLTCPQVSEMSERSCRVVFPAWRKWNERFRKAQERAVKPHE